MTLTGAAGEESEVIAADMIMLSDDTSLELGGISLSLAFTLYVKMRCVVSLFCGGGSLLSGYFTILYWQT